MEACSGAVSTPSSRRLAADCLPLVRHWARLFRQTGGTEACIMAYGLMKVLDRRRKIVEIWLYIEVALVFGPGILGLGHHELWVQNLGCWCWTC